MNDKPLELDKTDLLLCISGVRIVRDCGLLDDDDDKHAEALLEKLGQFVDVEERRVDAMTLHEERKGSTELGVHRMVLDKEGE